MHGFTARINILISCFCYKALATHESGWLRHHRATNLLSNICKVGIPIGSINCAAFEIFNELYLRNTIVTGTKSGQMASN
jgi:hypothetical protein